MQNANIILSILEKQSENEKDFCFKRLYRNLFNQHFYEEAYIKLYANKSIINKEKNGLSTENIEEIISLIKEEKYYPENLKDNKFSTLKDEVVLEIINQILYSIYNPIFSENSHGDRLAKNCKTALFQIKNTCNEKEWVVAENISNIFMEIDYDILLKLLANKIYDGRFIEIIRRYLKKGYIEFFPILLNVYFHELDVYMQSLKDEYKDIEFVRYKSSWLLFAKNKTISYEICDKTREFLQKNLKIILDTKSRNIVNLRDENLRFLDYEISISTNKDNSSIELLIPREIITKSLKPFVRAGEPIHCSKRLNLHVINIIKEYNRDIEKLYDYYSLANDRSVKLHRFKYYHYYSLAKTIAVKEKISVKRVVAKYGVDIPLKNGTGTRKIIGVRYKTNNGEKVLTYFNKLIGY